MLVCIRSISPTRAASAFFAFNIAVTLLAPSLAAQGTHLWTQSQMEEFEKGTPNGVAIDSDGHLRQSAGLTELVTTPSTFVWSLAVEKPGTIYAGTGTPASVLRLGEKPGDKPFALFETKDLTIQALCLGPDGALYGTTEYGGAYKSNGSGYGTVFSVTP